MKKHLLKALIKLLIYLSGRLKNMQSHNEIRTVKSRKHTDTTTDKVPDLQQARIYALDILSKVKSHFNEIRFSELFSQSLISK